MASKTLLIDGNSLIHRAYHAIPHLSTTSGQPTNAAFGFVQMLLLLLEAEQPDVAILALDAPGPTFRHELDDQYKANRPPMDEDLASQLGIIRELSEAMGLAITELSRYEADDIIGTLAHRASGAGDDVLVVSGDRDLLQLVGPQTRVLATIKGVKQTKTYDAAAVREELGVEPEAVADLKGLAGDTSDNIPGVPRVGPKTALDLLSQFSTIEDLYNHLDDIENEKLRRRLAENEDAARLSKHLAQIVCDAPVDEGLLRMRWDGLDVQRLRKLLGELEFTSLLNRLPAEVAEGKQLSIADSPEAIAGLCSRARKAPAIGIAVALENERAAGLAIATSDDQAHCMELSETDDVGGLFADEPADRLPACLRELLADADMPKVGHDLKGAAQALHPAGIALEGLAFDTQVAAYLIAAHRPSQSVEALMAQHLGESLPQADGPGVDGLPGPAAHAAAEAAAVLRLREPLTKQLEAVGARDLFETMEMPLAGILRDMELAGIAVDTGRLDEIGDKLEGMMLQLSQRVYALAGEEFNLDSPKQVAEVLFGRLKLPKGRRTKTGWSTSADVLEELAPDHEIVGLILQYREYAKLKSTYVDSLVRLVSPHDGRVHTTFEQTVASTGRLSSRNPNLQNIPIRTDWGREIRSCFVAQGKDNVLMAADYSQIELRILAHMSQDQSLLAAFRAGQDIHNSTAAAIFDVGLDSVTTDMRRAAKTVNYAVIYGMGSVALAKQLGIKRTEAQSFIDNYFERLPQVKAYMEEVVERGRQNGYVETLFGRRRPTPDLRSSDPRAKAYAERAAANAPLQGTAADIIKIAMVRLVERLPLAAAQCRMLLQVHDELVFELPQAQVSEAAPIVREVMENSAEFDVPLIVDIKAGANWRDMKHL